MAVEERDPHSGYMTTGHVWNGIKELNTPVPKVVYAFLIATFLFAVVYWVLMPAWPIGVTFTKGLLGIDQRTTVAEKLDEAARARSTWETRIATQDYAAIQADPQLMVRVRQTGHRLFADNCAACHGANAQGGPGFPNLTTTSWMWGGTPQQIAETIRVGINATHDQTRIAQMPAFGRDQMLPREEIAAVVTYVRSLSEPNVARTAPPGQLAAGKEVFAANCVACHGEAATGNIDVGAPNLTDRFWTFGGDLQSVFTTVWGGRQGHMPAWEPRLSPVDRKILTLYLLDLRTEVP